MAEDLWYLVGLITADGSLSKDGRHLCITSADKNYLEQIRDRFFLRNKIGIVNKGKRNQAYRIQFGDVLFYQFLESIGLLPNKSIKLGCLNIPDGYFDDFLRGLIDGDGNIHQWEHKNTKSKQWALRIYGGSLEFLQWLSARFSEKYVVKAAIYKHIGKHSYVLKMGKNSAKSVLHSCYYTNSFGLKRKIDLALECVNSP